MTNPWLTIPLADYEGHMALPSVGQAGMLSRVLGQLLTRFTPRSVALIGCAGGNGFEAVAAAGIERLVGIDINPAYVEDARARFADRVPGLNLYCADIEQSLSFIAPVDLVYAALVFEYVDVGRALANLCGLCQPGGVTAALLQLPKAGVASVSSSPFTSLQDLSAIMCLVPPQDFLATAAGLQFDMLSEEVIALESGKQFCLLVLRRAAERGTVHDRRL